MPELPQPAIVQRKRALSPSVLELVLMPQRQAMVFQPGQWVSVRLPVGEKPPLTRAYSMAEPVSLSGELVLVLDRVPDGLGSGYLASLKVGDQVEVAGPYGNFLWPQAVQREVVFFARFTGIVPIHCLLKHQLAQGVCSPVTLIYSSPHVEDCIYDQDFHAWARLHPQFRYRVLSGDAVGSVDISVADWPEVRALQELLGSGTDYLPMLSGVRAFVKPLRAYLTERGFDRKAVKHETYD